MFEDLNMFDRVGTFEDFIILNRASELESQYCKTLTIMFNRVDEKSE